MDQQNFRTAIMCEHLKILEDYLHVQKIPRNFPRAGLVRQLPGMDLFRLLRDADALQQKFQFPPFVVKHESTDPRSGTKPGLECTICKDAIMGWHPGYAPLSKPTITSAYFKNGVMICFYF